MDIDDEISLAIGKIINSYGGELLGKSLEIKGFLMDLLPKYKKERMLILTALSCGVGEALYKSKKESGVVTNRVQNTCKRYLLESYVSEDAANMVIKWLIASFEVTEVLPKSQYYEEEHTTLSIQDFDISVSDDTFRQDSSIDNESCSTSVTEVKNSVFRMRSLASRFLSSRSKKLVAEADNDYSLKYDVSRKVVLQGDLNCQFFTFDDNVHVVGERAFANAHRLEGITFTNKIEVIGKEAFINCSALTNIIILRSIIKIGEGAFKNCSSLTTVSLPVNILEIPTAMFKKCISLTLVNMPRALESIGDEAFRECSSLEAIIIPDTVKSIGDRAFMGCSRLRTITIGPNINKIGRDAFIGCSSEFHIEIVNNVRAIQYCILNRIKYNRLR